AGKVTVSKNALVHGLSGRTHACLPGEEGPFEQFCNEFIAALAPVGIVEQSVAEDIAGDRWRLKRARAMENALFSRIAKEQSDPLDPAAALADAWLDASKGLKSVATYATAFSAPSKRTPRIWKRCKPNAKPLTPRRRKKPSCSPNSPKPTAKPTTPRPISPLPEPPGSLFMQRPKSHVSSPAPAASGMPKSSSLLRRTGLRPVQRGRQPAQYRLWTRDPENLNSRAGA
ncbi:MAG: hypothetical protein WBY44_17630, partial [Bryobacteraceae bacterium]